MTDNLLHFQISHKTHLDILTQYSTDSKTLAFRTVLLF